MEGRRFGGFAERDKEDNVCVEDTSMNNPVVWGFDIGGTKCALCAADASGTVLCRWQIATADYDAWQDVMEALVQWGQAHAPVPVAAGVSCGGPLESKRGLILSPPNLPGWDEVPIVEWLEKRLGVPAFLQNDANACALAEWKYGAGRETRNMIFLTFGTGLGAGLILDGRLYEGTNGMAGEIGHVRLAKDGPVGYGKAGSAEGFCSGGGLAQLSQKMLGRKLTAHELVACADQGDEDAKQALALSARMLGKTLAVLMDLFNPECIVIGSIFARAERWYREEMEAVIAQEALSHARAVCRICAAGLGDAIGDLAAVTVAWNGLKEREKR